MLRITVQNDAEQVTFRLEGRLAGSWVQELADCWQSAASSGLPPRVLFDLTEVTFVDAAGKEFLAARHREGHELLATGCLMKYIVAEIAESAPTAQRVPEVTK